MWLHYLVCLVLVAPSYQELKIHENPFDGLSYGELIDFARIQDQGEVCVNENKCINKEGTCISKDDTCNGESYIGKKWCANSETCQCCVKPDCQSKTYTACIALNGTCIGINDVCDGQVAIDKAFCKNPSTCKCCFPKPKETSECESYTCGLPNIEGEHGCSESHTELIGGNTTFISETNINITEKTIGIRFLPGVLPELEPNQNHPGSRLYLRFESPEYPNGFFIIMLRESCYIEGCTWSFMRNRNAGLTNWDGRAIDCLPKNEWIFLNFRTYNNDNRKLYASLHVRGGFRQHSNGYSINVPANVIVTGIKADVGNTDDRPNDNTKHYTEISFDCNDNDEF